VLGIYYKLLILVGMLTHANLTFALCPIRFLPNADLFGEYYICVVDFYLLFSAVVFRSVTERLHLALAGPPPKSD
jgi:hypothetical protein